MFGASLKSTTMFRDAINPILSNVPRYPCANTIMLILLRTVKDKVKYHARRACRAMQLSNALINGYI